MKPLRSTLWLLLAWLACASGAFAHESRPAYLEIRQVQSERYELFWRTPLLSGMRLPVVLTLPKDARNVIQPNTQELSDSLLERRIVEVSGGLAGKRIEFTGLQGTITDVLVRTQLMHDGSSTTLVRPSQPWIDIAAHTGALAVAGAYVLHGVEHILLGYDHLLFVLALVLIVANLRVLFWTITSFTFAHSITLALATLGLVQVPRPPVEAVIALSILLLACEIVRLRRSKPSLTARAPWAIAFVFGLLHGFGFAGALAEIGLPRSDIPIALFTFNVGVEIGQLTFIGIVLMVIAGARRVAWPIPVTRYAESATTLAIGSLAAFWLIERVTSFWP
jgi:hydrogenase/urease accessory protein HupE